MSKNLKDFLSKLQQGKGKSGWLGNNRQLTIEEINIITETLLDYIDIELNESDWKCLCRLITGKI